MRPLRGLSSLKLKMGILIVVAIAVAVGVSVGGLAAGATRGWAILAAVVLALAVVQLLARGTTAPLREMAAAAEAMARGEHGRRVGVRGNDEIAHLATAFNHMSAELEQTDRVRRDLVANVAHELRTPLSALQATIENLQDGVQPADERTLAAMGAQVSRLSRMVEQLLDLSRMEAGELPLEPRRFAVSELLDGVRREAAQTAAGVSLEAATQPEDLRLEADPERLHQVLANLVDNAVRFSPAEGTVRLAAARRNGTVLLSVTDEGPGIPPEERERVFERFHSSDPARSGGSAGLGLAICRWIVEMHGGTIHAAAGDGGSGCRIEVALPGGGAR